MALLADSADPDLHHDLRIFPCQVHAARGAPPEAEEEAPAAAAAAHPVPVEPEAGPPPHAALQRELGVLTPMKSASEACTSETAAATMQKRKTSP